MEPKSHLKQEINKVLGAWNPIPVPEFLVRDEYLSYVEPIILIGNDFDRLCAYLKWMVAEHMGLGYDDRNPEHKADVEKFAKELIRVFETISKED